MLKAFRRRVGDNADINAMGRDIEEYTRPLTANPLLSGQLLKDVDLIGGVGTNLPHSLGRKPLGYIVTCKSIASDVTASKEFFTAQSLILSATVSTTVDVWVF